MNTAALQPPAWTVDALCAQTDPDAFFPNNLLCDTRQARAICGHCPVRRQCREWAITTGQEYGIWGGLTEKELRALVAQAGGAAA